MKYHISYGNPLTHYVNISLVIENITSDSIEVELPNWRPGRYEIANFSKNILKVSAYSIDGDSISIEKVTKSTWKVDTHNNQYVKLKYIYYAYEMDAGNSWLDETQIYLNFINCMLYVRDRINDKHTVVLDIPNSYRIACGLQQHDRTLLAQSYYQLVDSPMIASDDLQCVQYDIQDTIFNIWINGDHNLDTHRLVKDFEKFTDKQIETMGDFPCGEYHFLIQALPYRHYHGVEHENSTTITLGPTSEFNSSELYGALLGISSHELFHTWNVIRIRPKEMVPYEFLQENYFDTGYVAEGFTTYYGDLFLVKSGVKDVNWYISKLNTLLKRHYENFGRSNMSVAESSRDLWLDGYSAGIPNRKVSIYNEGAILALLMDLQIRITTHHKNSLDDVMRVLWADYKQKKEGYDSKGILSILETLTPDQSWGNFFDSYVHGTKSITDLLDELLQSFGCRLTKHHSDKLNESNWGFRMDSVNKIIKIEPNSIGEKWLSIGDSIQNLAEVIESKGSIVKLEVVRNYKNIEVELPLGEPKYFHFYRIEMNGVMTSKQKDVQAQWLNK